MRMVKPPWTPSDPYHLLWQRAPKLSLKTLLWRQPKIAVGKPLANCGKGFPFSLLLSHDGVS
jgi:hypothetical protein